MTILQVNNLNKKYQKQQVLNNLSFSIESNGIYSIVGTNGVGKTTLFKTILGYAKYDSGDININTERLGFVPDTPSLYEYLSGEEYLMFVSSILGVSKEQRLDIVRDKLKLFNLYNSKDKLLTTYSNGMKQKIAIASAIIDNPDILFLDEPLTGVDLISTDSIKSYLKDYAELNTVIFTTHILELAYSLSKKIFILHKGNIREQLSTNEFSLDEIENIIKGIYIND
ncbi:ABC transporter ATP-binding protein [Bacillus sp. S70]|jgi:ABC-2 type transport system ATP-binding protein|uniref:ABC transporter ATP-binding protein n=2 Tax=Bacillaceae TaxID=186817 RepID=UPI000B45053E|nr:MULTISPECIES: ABC transporter ATP-binding protein [Bacillus]MED2789931.1 ABC transporter ATP-binding protein [Bacillus thuringiensis]MBJ9979742.1 ABC transporter ATP-binding protein [Bacillus sp. S29]MBK0100920.1 ABC transporter ATP-binding protein [Bacillus sp. S70]MBK0105538.1 ABC transporter ATP-binding protein [Bacillus sp. S73]MBK0134369.1 ABC transporter ATP-binding protein [Bacillus sp. S72]